MSRFLSACIGLLFCFFLSSSQPQDADYWRLNFNQSPARHAYAASYHGVSEASHFLAERYWRQQRAQALAYYQRAVDQGDAAAAYSLAQRIPAQRDQWLQAAVELGDPRATLTIAKQLRATQPAAAIDLLNGLPDSSERNETLASLLFNHPYLLADDKLDWQSLAPKTPRWQQRLDQAAMFRNEHGYSLPGDAQCEARMTLYYHGDRARSALYDWLNEMAQHPFAKLGLCFVEAEPVASSHYQCGEDQVGRAHCQRDSVSTDGDFNIHVVSTGIANVRANDMAIAQTASFDVFIHEMAHLFALADEYPMRKELAQAFCSGRYRFSPLNLVITPSASEPVSYQRMAALQKRLPWANYVSQAIAIPVFSEQGDIAYRLGSQSSDGVGLFKVDTCEGTDFQAWRPVAGMTFMQQHELGQVPEVYLKLIRSHLQAE